MTRRSGGSTGILFMLAASAFFSGMAACVKAVADSLPTSEIVFARCVLPLPYLVLLARRRGARLLAASRGLITLRCLFGCGAMSLYFYGLGHVPLGDAMLLGKIQPVFVAMLAPFVLHERAGAVVILALAAALAGAALIIGPQAALGVSDVGLLIVLAALLSACAHVIIRLLTATEDPATVVLNFTAFVAVVAAAVGGADFVVPSLADLPAIAGVAVFATLGQLFMTHAYQADEAPGVAAAGYASAVFSMLLGWIFWDEAPSLGAWVGGGMVVGAGMLLVASRR